MFLQLVITSLLGLFSIIGTIFLMPFRLLGYRLFHFSQSNYVNIIESKLKDTAFIISNKNEPQNFAYGRWYVAYIGITPSQHGGTSTYIYIFGTQKMIDNLLKCEEDVKEKKNDNISYIKMLVKAEFGSWWGYEYSEVSKKIKHQTPNTHQSEIIESILAYHYDESNPMNITIVYIDGEPGSRKSSISNMLCERVQDSILCLDYKPCLCGGFL